MPVPQSPDDCDHGHIYSSPSVLGGNLKRTHPLRVSFLHPHGHPGTSSEDTPHYDYSNFTRGQAHRQTTPNPFGQLPNRQIVPARSHSHQNLGLIDAEGRIRHYCPFHGLVKPHVHEDEDTHTHVTDLGHVTEDGHGDSSISSSTSSDSESSVEISSKHDKTPQSPVKPQRKGCWQWNPVHHAMLISCYALLLLLAVLVGVVVSQSHRLSNRRRQPVQGGGINIRLGPGSTGLPQGPPPRIGSRSGGARRRRPQAAVPVPPPPPPPTTTTTTTTELPQYEYEYDYEYFDGQTSVAAPPPTPTFTTFQPQPPPTSRPVPISRPVQPVVRQQSFVRGQAVDRQSFRPSKPIPPPRRQGVSLAKIDNDFTLDSEPEIRGRKEPAVQIERAWSHQNSDGTFTWGYINTDGSYKNETKGTDCVVRGSYGYVDEATGQQIDVPYETGNPCNPDEPVVDYVDYDVQGFLATVRGGAPPPQQPQQQQRFDSSGSLRNRKF
ncbi:unnamed protein product [Meganyctiphanes norvegica]|uniref:Uncharacterized protein n=1 Tax=Meganyctiphanes norvegica TaxID=48144 RepID=A0AAV2S849_MEGNR